MLVKCARALDIDKVTVLLVGLSIAFQPSLGEAWFNLIHAHFLLGIALSLYVCVPTITTSPVAEGIFLLMASMSGTFSIVISPVIGAQLLLLRDFEKRKLLYLIVPACGLIQFLAVLSSHRISQVNTNVSEWIHAFVVFLSFGADRPIVFVASVIFWVVTAISVSFGSPRGLCMKSVSPGCAQYSLVVGLLACFFRGRCHGLFPAITKSVGHVVSLFPDSIFAVVLCGVCFLKRQKGDSGYSCDRLSCNICRGVSHSGPA